MSSWYADEPPWSAGLEADARRCFGDRLTVSNASTYLTVKNLSRGVLSCRTADDNSTRLIWARARTYRHAGITVTGRRETVPVTVVFEPFRVFDYNLIVAGRDFPRVYADPDASSPHRFTDGSLCLYYVADPPSRRWVSSDGLRMLLSMTADHLFFEDVYRDTHEWLGSEAPHALPHREVA